MKAAIRSRYGPPAILRVEEVDMPRPGDRDVLVRVFATTVNRTDCAILRASPFIMRLVTGLFRPRSPIPGTDFAGEVVGVGPGVTAFRVGDRVWGFDDNGAASQAQYLAFPEDRGISTIPGDLSYAQAAASPEGAHYAWNFLNKVRLEAGHDVLLNGAGGAIGSAALQLLKDRGARVTAVCHTRQVDLVRSLGADRVIDYTREDFTKDRETYDFVFDAVGKSTFARCKPRLRPRGVYISSELGPGAQNLFLALVTPLTGGKKVVFPVPTDIRGSLRLIRDLLEKGAFRPVIDRTYPLEQVRDAYEYVASGQKTGNVILSLE